MECRPTVKDIFDYIDSIAPFEAQCDWDNSGLIVGSFNAQVNKIGVVLDITCDAVKYSAQNGISAICAHTSLDIAKGGVNDALAAALGFENASPLTESGEEAMVRVAEIKPTTADELAELVADKLSTCVAVADGGKEIKKVALCGGAGSDFFEIAGCDAYITGEVKHHEFFKAAEVGITLIAAGHFETENPVVAVLAKKLKNNFGCEVEIIPQKSPVKYYR